MRFVLIRRTARKGSHQSQWKTARPNSTRDFTVQGKYFKKVISCLITDNTNNKVYEPLLIVGLDKFAGVDIRVRVSGGGHTSQIYAIRQAIAKSIVAYYQKYVDEYAKNQLKQALVQYDRTLLVAGMNMYPSRHKRISLIRMQTIEDVSQRNLEVGQNSSHFSGARKLSIVRSGGSCKVPKVVSVRVGVFCSRILYGNQRCLLWLRNCAQKFDVGLAILESFRQLEVSIKGTFFCTWDLLLRA